MKNRKVLVMLALTMALAGTMTACGFGGSDDPVVVDPTPTPEPTKAPDPTPTIAPDVQDSTYTSKNKTVSIKLPDATWANKSDEDNLLSFESPEQGKITILHGQGDEDMSVALIPETQDMATSLEKASDMEEGTDFVIHDYTANDVNGIGVYSYYVEYLNTDKSDGYAYTVNKVFANADEFYSIAASVKTNDAALLEKAKASVNSFTIVGDSALKSAAQGTADSASGDAAADGTTDGTATTDGTTTDGTAADGTATDSTGTSTDGSSSDGSYSDSSSSDDALTDTNQTRTIYRNSDGAPRVIYADGNGGWVDDDGNTFRFANDEDVYDQDDVDYYYHGEAADVYYMPIESE